MQGSLYYIVVMFFVQHTVGLLFMWGQYITNRPMRACGQVRVREGGGALRAREGERQTEAQSVKAGKTRSQCVNISVSLVTFALNWTDWQRWAVKVGRAGVIGRLQGSVGRLCAGFGSLTLLPTPYIYVNNYKPLQTLATTGKINIFRGTCF